MSGALPTATAIRLLRRQVTFSPRTTSFGTRSSRVSAQQPSASFNTASLKWNRVAGTRGVVRLSSTLSAVDSFNSYSSSGASSSSTFSGHRTHLQLQIQRKQSRAFATTVMASSTHDARVVTYNVLSSSLCEPDYFAHCDPNDLHPPNRLAKLLAKLEPEMAKGAVIGLQEVSQKWAGQLHVFFAKRGYHMICSLYGKPFNGYMGIALAVPLAKYDVSKVDISRCSDTKKLPREPKPGLLQKVINYPINLYRKVSGERGPQSDWQLANGRFNTIMYASLKCKESGAEFGVANYHMPCMFRNPKVMTIHSQLAAMYAQQQSGNLPVILMGDFNLKPGDGGYDLITTGTLASDHEAAPVPPAGEEWSTSLKYPMRSAYKVANGAEPDFTNFAQIKDDPQFIDTLDYIFISPKIEVAEVLQLPHRSEVKGPFPAPDEPSDHILLAATLRV